MPVLAGPGLRAIAADLAGFGRSDKPAEIGDHSYARHVEWIRALAFDRPAPGTSCKKMPANRSAR
jgi:haloalkane dehalogenase